MTPLVYELRRSRRKTIGLQITPAGKLIVQAPRNLPEAEIRALLETRRDWIARHLSRIARLGEIPGFAPGELDRLSRAAREDLPRRAEAFAPLVGVDYGRITIRAMKSCWGSCRSTGNLTLNCLLMLVPEDVRDYVIVHELCHRRHMNHSPAFWSEVERVLPDYRCRRQWLKDHGDAIIARLNNTSG